MTWLAYSHLGVPKAVQLTTQPAVALAGIPFGVQPVGRLVDGGGVLSRTTGATVTSSKAGGVGMLSGTLSVQTVEGVFTFTDLKMDTVTSAVTLQFASSGLTSAVSNAFNVTQPNITIGIESGTYAITGTAQTLTRGPYMMRQDTVGSYAITGTAATLTGPGVTWLANKPSNYLTQLVGDFDCSANLPAGTIGSERNVAGTDWTVIYDRNNGGGVSAISRQTDATAPRSPSDVWRWHQPAGDYGTLGSGGGTGFGNLFAFLPGGTTKVYACWAMKLSAGYYVHPISNKLFECFNTGGGDVMVQLGHNGVYFEGYDQNTDTVYDHLINTAPLEDTWFQVEVQFERGNPGVLKVWIDGELRTNITAEPVAAGQTFETVGLYMHMGGGGFDLSADQYIWVDHISVYTE